MEAKAVLARLGPLRIPALALGALAAGFVALSVLAVILVGLFGPPKTLLMAREAARLGGVAHDWVPIEEISPHLRRAVMAAEDSDFCAHWGFDLDAIVEAIGDAEGGGRLRGASTLSQQTAKNLFLWPDRSWVRKGLEVWFTALIELTWSKRRILEIYLNIAEFGQGVFGVEAAAQAAYGLPAADLSLWRASRLVVALPSPRRRHPGALSGDLEARAEQVSDGARTLEGEGRADCVAD